MCVRNDTTMAILIRNKAIKACTKVDRFVYDRTLRVCIAGLSVV
jgi:hypothetical protein